MNGLDLIAKDINECLNAMKKSPKIVTGLIGRGILASKSPNIHQQESKELGLNLRYQLLDFDVLGFEDEKLQDALNFAIKNGFNGVNITHPFKQKIIPLLDDLSTEAKLLGAVNTVVIKGNQAIGHNTDWYGFYHSFLITFGHETKEKVLQLGAGGAGSATIYALLRLGVKKLFVFDPDISKVEDLKQRFKDVFPDQEIIYCNNPTEVLEQVDGVVQTSPIGMAHHKGMPMPLDNLHANQWVFDIIYFPEETEFLKTAKAKGSKCLNGDGMVVYQAAEALKLFTNHSPDTNRMMINFKKM